MLIIGAKGHAKEVLDILENQNKVSNVKFFDDITTELPIKLYNTFPIIRSEIEVKELFKQDPNYILGLGGCLLRYKLTLKMDKLGGKLTSVISNNASIGHFNVELEEGLNIMQFTFISNDVKIGKGSLINTRASLHHDVHIGCFCEISPGAILTGGVRVGNYSTVGSGAVILPKIRIGSNVTIGAGSVVTKDIIENDVLVVGIPAKIVRRVSPINI
jgi:sugar O-acyltransferase (sialic acid O-acetyltransferase NeuD family)